MREVVEVDGAREARGVAEADGATEAHGAHETRGVTEADGPREAGRVPAADALSPDERPVADRDSRPDLDEPRPRPRSPRPNGGPGRAPRPGPPAQHRPSPADLADLAGSFALTAGVQDPEPQPASPTTVDHRDQQHDHRFDDPAGERGLRGLVGGGSSQVSVTAAMRARDASRPTDEDLALAEAELPIVRRGWVPRDELPRPH